MSRIGKMPVEIPAGVTIELTNKTLSAKGPKGELSIPILSHVKVSQEDNQITVNRVSDEKIAKAQHGLVRTLIFNLVEGVSKGFEKKLEINGVGYKVNLAGKTLKLSLGYSHEVVYELPEGIDAQVDGMSITVSGADKQQVGQIAAEIRALRKPEPYKGKGIKYADEYIIRKAGKAAGGGGD